MPEASGEKMPIIYLSMLFKWYAEDFGSSKIEILKWIYKNMADEANAGTNVEQSRKVQIGKIVNGNAVETSGFKLKYIPYDWGNNAKKK